MSSASKHPETIALHAGWRADPATGAVAVPIYQTTSYQFRDTEHAANLFALKELGNIYTRIMNPTNDVLEKRVAALEGGVAALALASGQAASAFALQNLARAGDNVVSSTDLYGGTWNLFANTLKDQGIEVRFVDPVDPDNFRRATDDRTRAYYAETLPNPKLTVFPIAEVAAIGRNFGVPLVMDNTAAPILVRPFDHGAAVIVYSTTKYIGGHGNSIGGLLVDSGNFDWAAHPTAPAGAQHARSELSRRGLDRGGQAARADRLHHQGAGDAAARHGLGAVAVQCVPHPAGIGDAGAAHGQALREHAGGDRFPAQAAGDRQGHSSLGADRRASRARRANISRAEWAASSASSSPAARRPAAASSTGCRCSITSPISAMRAASRSIPPPPRTRSSTPQEQEATGVSDGYVRLSVGIEHIDDIIADIERGLAAAGKVAKAA